MKVYRFTCGHVGRTNESDREVKAQAFIRVAEIRGEKTEDVDKPCPDCR